MQHSPCEVCPRQGSCAVMTCERWRQWFAAEWQAVRTSFLSRRQR